MRARGAALIVIALLAGGVAKAALGQSSVEADLRSVPAVRADARADRTVTEADLAELGKTVERSVTYVEGLFERPFTAKPKLVLFGSTESFSAGLAQLFNYSEGSVTMTSASYGGIFDPSTNTIAVNLQTIGTEDVAPTLDHEFTHYMVRQIIGRHTLPAWFDEGVATLVERHTGAGSWPAQDALVGQAIAASGRVSLAPLETLDGWHVTYPRFGQTLYTYAAAAASRVIDRVGWPGVLDIVSGVGDGRPFADAYRAAAGEPFAELEARFTNDARPVLISRRLASGDAQWTLFSGKPLTPETVTIGGSRSTYVVTFTVTTDDLGLYRGSFGSTAPPGTYLIGAAGARVEITTGAR